MIEFLTPAPALSPRETLSLLTSRGVLSPLSSRGVLSPCHPEECFPPVIPSSAFPLSSRAVLSPCHPEECFPPVIPRSSATRDLLESAPTCRLIPNCGFLADARNDSGRRLASGGVGVALFVLDDIDFQLSSHGTPFSSVIPTSGATRDLFEAPHCLS